MSKRRGGLTAKQHNTGPKKSKKRRKAKKERLAKKRKGGTKRKTR